MKSLRESHPGMDGLNETKGFGSYEADADIAPGDLAAAPTTIEETLAKLTEKNRYILKLQEIAGATGVSMEEKIQSLLEFGCEWTQLPVGLLTRVEDEMCKVEGCHSNDSRFFKGVQVPLPMTFCKQAMSSGEALSIEIDRQPEYQKHIANTKLGIKVYFGTTIYVGQEAYGTLVFLGFSPLNKSFSPAQKHFFKLMAQWIGYELLRLRQMQEIEKHQQALLHMNQMATMGEMAYGIIGEIGSPLAAISGRSQLLRKQLERGQVPAHSIIAAVERIDESVRQIQGVMKGLRQFSGDTDLYGFRVSKTSEIVENILGFCSARFRREGILFYCENMSLGYSLECRPFQVSQVLLNLLNNAADAVGSSRERWIELRIEDAGDKIRFVVRDSGAGVPVPIQDRIMEPFFTTKDSDRGVGLGLSVSLGLMCAHAGKLFLDTTDSRTAFVAEFPKKQKKQNAA